MDSGGRLPWFWYLLWFECVAEKLMSWKLNLQIHMLMTFGGGTFVKFSTRIRCGHGDGPPWRYYALSEGESWASILALSGNVTLSATFWHSWRPTWNDSFMLLDLPAWHCKPNKSIFNKSPRLCCFGIAMENRLRWFCYFLSLLLSVPSCDMGVKAVANTIGL